MIIDDVEHSTGRRVIDGGQDRRGDIVPVNEGEPRTAVADKRRIAGAELVAEPALWGKRGAGSVQLDYDCNKFRLSASPIIDIAHRAKKLDGVAQKFISGHPTAVGLDLGAGLDTRIFRVNPPPTIDWYDVDFPEVIDDPREPERWNPRLKLIKEILLTREPEVAQFPLVLRLFTRLAAHSTAFSRRGTIVLHYGF